MIITSSLLALQVKQRDRTQGDGVDIGEGKENRRVFYPLCLSGEAGFGHDEVIGIVGYCSNQPNTLSL
eukprot:scaffold3055_cov60-Cyclotella_meneghiniana.AAC.2